MKKVWIYTITLSGKVSDKKATLFSDFLFDLVWFIFGKKVIAVTTKRWQIDEAVSNEES